MKPHYTKKHVVAKVVLLSVLFFCSSFSLFSSSKQGFEVSGITNPIEANGVYIEAGKHSSLQWAYFKHETNNYYLYVQYYQLPGIPPFPGLTYAQWVIGDSFYSSRVVFDYIYDLTSYQEPTSYEGVTVTNITPVFIATTEDATHIASTSATLNATVRAENATGEVSFEYGTTASYGTEVSATPNQVSGSEDVPVSVTIADLASNTTYYYRVKIESGDEVVYGDNFTFQTEDISGNVEVDVIPLIVVYPNPTTNGFYIDVEDEVNILTIYNISGCIVYQQHVSGKSYVDIRDLRNGIYFVQINGNQTTLVKSE
jgi:hypothetical protein